MNALGYRLPLICLVGMGLVGCSAAGENSAMSSARDDDQPGIASGASSSAAGAAGSHSAGGSTSDTDSPTDDGPSAGKGNGTAGKGSGAAGMGGGTGGSAGTGNSDCGIGLPGVTVDHGEDGITIVVDLPNDASLVIGAKGGDCKSGEGGIDITGDVTIDLGNGEVPLLDADIHVGIGGGMPTITGTADVDGGLLDGVIGVGEGAVEVAVSLDPNVGKIMPQSGVGALLDLELSLPTISVGCGCFPAMNGDLPLVDADVVVSVDGAHKVVRVAADVAANAGPLWTSMVPLHAMSDLSAVATISDGTLVNVEFDGNLAINDRALWCGLAPLVAIELPSAKLMLDAQGATLTASTRAALHPGFSLNGRADLDAHFAKHDWSINLYGAAMVDLTLLSAKVTTCLDLSASGVKVCEKPTAGSPSDD